MNPSADQAVNSWLTQLNPADHGLVLDAYGQCQLATPVAGLCTVFVPAPDSALFYLYTDIGQMPGRPDAALCKELLSLNLLGRATCGGVLGLDKHTRSMVFSYMRDIASTDVRLFCTILDNFCAAAVDLKKRLSTLSRPDTRTSTVAPAPRTRFR